MQSKAESVAQYIAELPPDRKEAMMELRKTILASLPEGFSEEMSYGMIGYVVPLSMYPAGYHCNPKLPLQFMTIGSQKNFVVVHHIGMYADENLQKWVVNEYPKYTPDKLDMGKGCLRFKRPDKIPFIFIGELASKISPQQWISFYEAKIKR